jgi:Ser/Thr protein kinase RdoA (MazF antagonist)
MAALADEQRRKREKPELNGLEAVNLAHKLFGIDMADDTQQLNSYDDANWLLRARDGDERYVLKVHNGVESSNPQFIEAQNDAMRIVHVQDGCWCPVPLPSVAGETIAFARLSSGERVHAIRLLPFMPARLLSDVQPTPALIERVGAMLGRVTGSLATFEHAAARRSSAWDPALFLTAVPQLINSVATPADRELIRQVVSRFDARVTPIAHRLRSQVIHGDLNDQNILVSVEEGPSDGAVPHPTEPVGVIDFGDMVFSFRVADPAIAAAYLVIQMHYYAAASPSAEEVCGLCASLLSGFASVCELDRDEWAALPTVVLARIATSLVFGSYSASLDPTNKYLTLTLTPGWRCLRLLLSMPEAQFAALLQPEGTVEAIEPGRIQ